MILLNYVFPWKWVGKVRNYFINTKAFPVNQQTGMKIIFFSSK